MILETKDITKTFEGFTAVDSVSLGFEPETITAIIGPNGAGKTTFVNLCTGLYKPDSGRILFRGRDITNLPPEKRVKLGISRTFQIVNVFPMLTVEGNLRIPLLSVGGGRKDLQRLLEVFGLSDKAGNLASELSHGDLKLLEMAMAIATRPSLLFLDEPMAGVNPAERARMMELIRELRDSEGLTIVIIEHDMEVVFGLAERIVVMNRGKVIADGSPEEIRRNEFVREIYLKGVEV